MDARRQESVWFEQTKYELAEAKFQSVLANRHEGLVIEGKGVNSQVVSISTEIGKAMDLIGKSLNNSAGLQAAPAELEKRVGELEKDNANLRAAMDSVMQRLNALEGSVKPPKVDTKENVGQQAVNDDDEDDDFDLFGDVDEEEVAKMHEERQKLLSKKDSKPRVVAKSSLILDIKPWDDETDMSALEKQVRLIKKDGLLWGGSKLLPVAYGIKKLQICCVVEDDKVGTDFLEESIQGIEDYVQSMDIVAFNKV